MFNDVRIFESCVPILLLNALFKSSAKRLAQRGRLKGEWCGGLYGAVALQNRYLCGYVLYRGGCVFVLRWAMKCPTAFISGYPSCIIVEIRGAIALILWQILFSVVTDPAMVGRFSRLCECINGFEHLYLNS